MDDVTVVFTREQAELVQVLLDDPHLLAYQDETAVATRGARNAVQAGLNAVDQDPGCEPWVEAETGYNGPEVMG